MPFSSRVVPQRTEIRELFSGHQGQNVLEKNSVSHMVGVLQQLNMVSRYASEVFADIFTTTENNHQRLITLKQRLTNMNERVPRQESLLIDNSPMFFYDNPFMGQEFSRKDPNQGLLFRRDRCTNEVNRRRQHAAPIPDFTSLDQFSADGQPNSTKFSDSRFFINEWLRAEEIKIKEEKKKRKALRAERKARRDASGKSGKIKRQATKQIIAVSKKRFDANTGKVIEDVDSKMIDVQDFQLLDNNVANGSKRISTKPQIKAYEPPSGKGGGGGGQSSVSTVPLNGGGGQRSASPIPNQHQQQQHGGRPPPPAAAAAMAAAMGAGGRGNGNGPPAPPTGVGGGPPPAPGGGNMQPPPIPMAAKEPTPPPMAYGGAAPNVQVVDGQQLGGPPPPHNRAIPSYMNVLPDQGGPVQNNVPAAQPAPPRPAFMAALIGGDAKAALKSTPKVERQIPMDSRSAMLSQLQGKKAKSKLRVVDREAIQAQRAAEHKDESALVSELMKRRAWLEDDDDDDEEDDDSDWDD